MNGIHEKHHMLQNAIEALVTHTGDDRQRAISAVNEITSLKAVDFPEHLESSYFAQLSGFTKDLRAGRISDENLRRLKGNMWALYKSVSVSRDSQFRKME
ncbi:hypothetical protein V2K05_06650 [Pseudomonas alliivorans]|nr:hypothetical protein [Pseudomonas alliivorans]MEE4962281.1 hypothetical protein [Pseudomonas alliivorans]MEE4970474.1 hypothetical protein [Pseudomonas alliivorans]MEE4975767.1 hypothetical protein [Pseudomonas alliivorans]MEE4980866.1 hypothetical protein [Pseudomonas alliivorans]